MNKKHMLSACVAIISSFFIVTIAADVVLGSNAEEPQKGFVEVASSILEDTDSGITKAEEENESTIDVADAIKEDDTLDDLMVMRLMEEPVQSEREATSEQEVTSEQEATNEQEVTSEQEATNEQETISRQEVIHENESTNDISLFSLPVAVLEEVNKGDGTILILEDTSKELEASLESILESKKSASITYDKVIANVSESLNIRTEASTDAKVVGRLFKDSYGVILERGDEWTKISSGNVTGYVNNDYLYMDEEAISYVESTGSLVVEVLADSVNIRQFTSTESDIIGKSSRGNQFTPVYSLSDDEWNAIEYEDGIAYISEELSTLKLNLKTARTIEEIEAEQKAVELAKVLEAAKHVKVGKTTRAAIDVSDEEIFLMATVIASEALSESYEGKIAVANVIINRMLKGSWGKSVTSVVYAPGQFSGSGTGRFERFAKLVNEDCKKAAIEALAGVNNVGDFLYFISKPKANYSNYSKYYILGNHCFYMR